VERDVFWAHNFYVVPDQVYGDEDEPLHRLDLYLQGTRVGEPWYIHTDGKPKPTLFYVHGGGFIEGDKLSRLPTFLPFVERAWNVVSIDYRIGPNTAPQAVDDVMLAAKWVADHAEEYLFDLSRVVISGESAGGHLALIAGMFNTIPGSHEHYVGDRMAVRAVVNWFGVADLEQQEADGAAMQEDPTKAAITWIGDKARVKPISDAYSPVHFVTPNAPAVLTIHGDQDSLVPHKQATILHDALERHGVVHRLHTVEGGNHGGFTDAQYQEVYRTIFSFLAGQGVE